MTLRTKLIFLCAVPLAGLAICVLVSYALTRTIGQGVTQAKDESAVFADLARNLQLDVVQVQQFLTDASATRLQDGLDDGLKEAEENRKSFLAGLQKFREMYQREHDTAKLARVNDLEKAFAAYYENGSLMAQAYVKDGTAAGNKMMGNFDKAADQLSGAMDPFVAEQINEFNSSLVRLQTISRRTNTGILLCGIVLGLLTVVLAARSIRSITGPIREVSSVLLAGAEQTTSAASLVSTSSQSLAEGASKQAASIEETSASLEELSSMTKRNSENSQKANDLAKQARTAADKGVVDMQAMSTAMDAIKASSDDIAKIIKTIDEIAFQTNILALNAAVEAARAGEAGLGFAVVADEVRNLAQRSAQAAKETAAKIEGAIAKTGQGVGISKKVAETLNEIVSKARQVDELAAEVAGASREQTQGITQINSAVGEMDKVTQSNAANAEESAAAAEELNAQAETMKQSVMGLLELIDGNQPAGPSASSSHRTNGHSSARSSLKATSNRRQNGHTDLVPSRSRNTSMSVPLVNAQGVIAWDEPSMSTGVDSIDSQHQTLIEHINELHTACLAGTAKEELLEMLAFLGEYVQSHFKHEEGIMQQHQCPVRGKNKAAHIQFLKDFESLVGIVKRDGASTAAVIQLKEMLGNWLKNHICSVDTNLRSCQVHEF